MIENACVHGSFDPTQNSSLQPTCLLQKTRKPVCPRMSSYGRVRRFGGLAGAGVAAAGAGDAAAVPPPPPIGRLPSARSPRTAARLHRPPPCAALTAASERRPHQPRQQPPPRRGCADPAPASSTGRVRVGLRSGRRSVRRRHPSPPPPPLPRRPPSASQSPPRPPASARRSLEAALGLVRSVITPSTSHLVKPVSRSTSKVRATCSMAREGASRGRRA